MKQIKLGKEIDYDLALYLYRHLCNNISNQVQGKLIDRLTSKLDDQIDYDLSRQIETILRYNIINN